MARRLVVTARAPHAPLVEVVERKGAGHPDTLCDHLVDWRGVADRLLAGHYPLC